MLNKAMKRILNLHMATITLLASVLMASAADKPRTLKSVDKPLDKIQGTVSGARKLSAAELAAARKALLIAAPSLSEVLENLAKDAKGLEKTTGDLADEVKEDHNAQTEKAKDLLSQQQKLNERVAQMQQALRRDANQQNLAQKEGRERARDADDAVAMLHEPPRDAANALEESTANPKPEDQQQSLEQAAKAQKQLAANLSQLAEHYKNLEEGRLETADTREALRAQEEALGIKEALDQQFAMLERLMELANKPPAEALKDLEAELAKNPVMREELENIAEQSLQNANQDLEAAAKEQQQLAEALKEPLPNDPAAPMNAQQLAAAAAQLAKVKIPEIKKTAEDAKAEDAQAPLDEAAKALNQAAAQQNAAAMEQPLKAAAAQLEAAANEAAEAAKDANTPEEKQAAEDAQKSRRGRRATSRPIGRASQSRRGRRAAGEIQRSPSPRRRRQSNGRGNRAPHSGTGQRRRSQSRTGISRCQKSIATSRRPRRVRRSGERRSHRRRQDG